MTGFLSQMQSRFPSLFRRSPSVSVDTASTAVLDRGATAPAEEHREQTTSQEQPQQTAQQRRFEPTIEHLLWAGIFILAVITRFWDLSSRAQNHDESLHSYFSWLYYANYDYTHDPLMHGPALFHGNAIAYFLFGDSDYVSRLVPALLGVLIVMMPFLLRGKHLLGKWGALSAAAILMFSPSILYYSRFIRHDVYTLAATMAIVIFLLRYLEKPATKWLIFTGITTGFLFATKEVSFIVAFILVTFVALVLAWQIHKGLVAILVATGAGLLVVFLGMEVIGAPALPPIPWENPTQTSVRTFAFDLAVHPVILGSLGVLGLGIVATWMVIDRLRTPDQGFLKDVFGSTPDGTTSHTVFLALRDRAGILIGIAAGLVLFVTLYTSLFTNMGGLGSATFGALGYWLGQHDVQRGDQPWFYYLLLLPQYEFIAVLAYPVAAVLTLWHIVPRIIRGEQVGRCWYMRGFFLYWATVMLMVLSWAGEKMPWLAVHVVAPMILLAASFIGEAIEYVERKARAGALPKTSVIIAAAGVPILTASWFLLWSWGTAGPWIEAGADLVRSMRPEVSDNPWILFLPLLALILLIAFALTRLGPKTGVAVLGIGCFAALLMGQLHVSYRFVYKEGDVAVDMLTYSQVSPDVPRVVEEIGLLSRQLNGDTSMQVYYDSGTSWPFQWYLRNYENKRFFGTELTAPPDAPIVLISREHLTAENEAMLSGYTYQDYSMRWFFPEVNTYRRFAYAPDLNDTGRQNYQDEQEGPFGLLDVAGSVWDSIASLRDPQQQADMFRLVAFREMWTPITSSYDFRVYVRNDLAEVYNDLRY